MKNSISYLLIALFIGCSLSAQVKIGDNPQNLDPASVLELESTDKVLVITRVTTAQMNAIVPMHGALTYNTDLQSVHYYDGTQWVDIGGTGGGADGPFTTDPIVNTVSTIVITPTATGSNFEVAPNSIRTEQIVDGGINGTADIQDGSIDGEDKLMNNSVTEEKLSENSVGAFALDNDNIGVSAFINDVPFLTADDLIGIGGTDDQNLTGATLNASNILQIDIEDGNSTTVDLSSLAGGGNQNLGQVLTQGNDGGASFIKNILDPVDLQDAATKAYVDAAVTSGGTLADGTILIGDASNAAQQLAVSGDATIDNLGALTITDNAINSTKIEDFSITTADLNDMGATTDGEILQWDTTENGWVVANNSGGHTGTPNSIFFAGADGAPTDTEGTPGNGDNGALFWDSTKRFNTGALYIGLKKDAAEPDSPVGDNAKVVIAERSDGLLAYPLQIQNEAGSTNNGSAVGVLFSVERFDSFGKGGLVYERTGAWGVGDFHFLQNTVGDNTIPTLADKVFTIENDGDIVLTGDLIARNGAGAINQVLTTTATGTEWAAPSGGGGLPSGDTNGQLLSSLGAGSYAWTDPLVAADIPYDNTVSSLTATDAQAAIDELASVGGTNLSNTDLAQTAGENRAYDLNGQELVFTGSGRIGIGDFGNTGPASVRSKLDVDGQITASIGFASTEGTVGQPGYSFFTNADTNTGMFRIAEDQLGFSAGGQEILRLSESDGNGLEIIAAGSLELEAELIDITGNVGTAGQVLTSTSIGTEWKEPAVIAMGKANGANSININNAVQSISGATGVNTVNFVNARPNNDYIIQLTVVGDNRIYVTSQLVGSFTVEIRSNTDNSLVVAEWYFTVLDF